MKSLTRYLALRKKMLTLSHKNLEVYKYSRQIVEEIYKITKFFPKEELFVLTAQIRRAAISISSNIAEGASRITKSEKKRFFEISRSSLVELDTQFEIALNLEFIKTETLVILTPLVQSTFKMLSKMIENLTPPLATRH